MIIETFALVIDYSWQLLVCCIISLLLRPPVGLPADPQRLVDTLADQVYQFRLSISALCIANVTSAELPIRPVHHDQPNGPIGLA